MHLRNLLAMAGPVLLSVACSATTPATSKSTSTLEGQLAVSSFASTPKSVSAVDERGARTIGNVDADGAFSLILTKGHRYQLSVVGTVEEPMVYPRAGGSLERGFRISSDASRVDLGLVHHFDRAPEVGFGIKNAKTGAPCTDSDGADKAAADPTQPMAVPEKNPPSDVAGCNDGEDGQDDGETED